jgi:beta-lactamase superfamily II metal-dependent hydrolase
MRAAAAAIIVAGFTVAALAQTPAGRSLTLYLIDVEGGNATLMTLPSGESILFDTGNGGAAAARDADRIMAAVRDAGVTQIDFLVTTHAHTDHVGAMSQLVGRIPVRRFVDHGESVELKSRPDLLPFNTEVYPALYAKGTRIVVKPGDRLAVKGLDARIVTSAGQAIQSALPGGGRPNPYCAQFTRQAPDATENAQSVGTHVTFGQFRLLYLGDLTANKEFDLMCPSNRLGTIDLLVASHHGQSSSNDKVLVHAIEPRVILINNGIRKGGQPEAMTVFHSAPGVENIWQLHFSELSGQEYTVPSLFIANLVDDPPAAMPIAPQTGRGARGAGGEQPPRAVHDGAAFWLKVTAREDGSFTVTNARNGFTKTYAARRAR